MSSLKLARLGQVAAVDRELGVAAQDREQNSDAFAVGVLVHDHSLKAAHGAPGDFNFVARGEHRRFHDDFARAHPRLQIVDQCIGYDRGAGTKAQNVDHIARVAHRAIITI